MEPSLTMSGRRSAALAHVLIILFYDFIIVLVSYNLNDKRWYFVTP